MARLTRGEQYFNACTLINPNPKRVRLIGPSGQTLDVLFYLETPTHYYVGILATSDIIILRKEGWKREHEATQTASA